MHGVYGRFIARVPPPPCARALSLRETDPAAPPAVQPSAGAARDETTVSYCDKADRHRAIVKVFLEKREYAAPEELVNIAGARCAGPNPRRLHRASDDDRLHVPPPGYYTPGGFEFGAIWNANATTRNFIWPAHTILRTHTHTHTRYRWRRRRPSRFLWRILMYVYIYMYSRSTLTSSRGKHRVRRKRILFNILYTSLQQRFAGDDKNKNGQLPVVVVVVGAAIYVFP